MPVSLTQAFLFRRDFISLSFFLVADGPTVVNVNLYVRSFEKIDDVKMVSIEERKSMYNWAPRKKKERKRKKANVPWDQNLYQSQTLASCASHTRKGGARLRNF